ncbi:fumarylacetoacetate hydrolase family protein [Micromonospora sonneratiae]|uniref:2-keto-4-pentenoate hydratase n=1 Tax=Micromonospora sonneratiae TaxID=1184706 RepID=A0ABW3YH83_9ACTN
MTDDAQSPVVLAAQRLRAAAESGKPCNPVRDLLGSTDVGLAYAVQQANAAITRTQGRVRVGRKIGLTSEAVQRQLGVDQPDFGSLFDDMAISSGGTVAPGRLLQPKVEAEVAFVLGADLDGPLESVDDVRAAVAGAAAAIEIVDSRVANWDISIVDTVADNASSGLYVVSEAVLPLTEVDPVTVQMTLRLNGEVASAGEGRACLGDPLNAVLWLARTAQELGDPLRAGEIVLSGALGPMVVVEPGDTVSAEISQLGSVAVSFEAEE